MGQLKFSQEELEREHPYASPHEVNGAGFHGGFDETGKYLSPRMLVRGPAVSAWQQQLVNRGHALLDADTQLLTKGSYPTPAQHKLLLQHGLGRTLWNTLTITGVVEARGRMLIEVVAPDFQQIVLEDLSETAIGHLNKGLLRTHGMDEGGDPGSSLGGHDLMWFAVRDMVFGKDAYPVPEVPESIGRPESDKRLIPQIPIEHEMMVHLLMDVLMIEVRAENTFALNIQLMRDADLFTDRREIADAAADLVQRIRDDEQIHVGYLRTVLSELRSFTFQGQSGETVPGRSLIDPAWNTMVEWHAEQNPVLQRERTKPALESWISEHADGATILAAYEQLEPKWSRN